MNAYEMSEKIKELWSDCMPKNSGELNKDQSKIFVCVHTNEGYKQVNNVRINKLGFIELMLDD